MNATFHSYCLITKPMGFLFVDRLVKLGLFHRGRMIAVSILRRPRARQLNHLRNKSDVKPFYVQSLMLVRLVSLPIYCRPSRRNLRATSRWIWIVFSTQSASKKNRYRTCWETLQAVRRPSIFLASVRSIRIVNDVTLTTCTRVAIRKIWPPLYSDVY